MADFAKVSLILRRLVATLALAILLTSVTACFDQETAGLLFLPAWAALFFSWRYLSGKLNFNVNISRAPRRRPKRPTEWGRVIVTGLIAFGITLLPAGDFFAVAGPLLWIALYYGWPALSRRLPLPESWKVKAQSDRVSSVPTPGFWRFLGRGAFAMLSIVTVMVLLAGMLMAPIRHSLGRARKIHDSIRVGMTLPEVMDASRDCDLFAAASESGGGDGDAGESVPTMGLSRNRDGAYRINGVAMTETQAAERLQAKVHDGNGWRSNCVNVNLTPMHVSFSVIFGPDGRVTEVTPVRGWD